jgi:hypothetical protein
MASQQLLQQPLSSGSSSSSSSSSSLCVLLHTYPRGPAAFAHGVLERWHPLAQRCSKAVRIDSSECSKPAAPPQPVAAASAHSGNGYMDDKLLRSGVMVTCHLGAVPPDDLTEDRHHGAVIMAAYYSASSQ